MGKCWLLEDRLLGREEGDSSGDRNLFGLANLKGVGFPGKRNLGPLKPFEDLALYEDEGAADTEEDKAPVELL